MHVSEFKSHLYASTNVLNLNTQFEKKKKKKKKKKKGNSEVKYWKVDELS
jgi:hypothetical protein